jgi:hypothetical protein
MDSLQLSLMLAATASLNLHYSLMNYGCLFKVRNMPSHLLD